MSESGVIRLSQVIPQPPAAVWQALTNPEIHARWWGAGDIKPEPGHKFMLDMGRFGQQPCEVLAVEPERLFSYLFSTGMLNTTITWRLEPEGDGTRLQLEHSGFDLNSPIGKMAHDGLAAGWPQILARIEPALAK
jgi:uncharacterized protein YndB with AHSA1/START domain